MVYIYIYVYTMHTYIYMLFIYIFIYLTMIKCNLRVIGRCREITVYTHKGGKCLHERIRMEIGKNTSTN